MAGGGTLQRPRRTMIRAGAGVIVGGFRPYSRTAACTMPRCSPATNGSPATPGLTSTAPSTAARGGPDVASGDETIGIVGGGIIGLAVGRELLRRRPGTRVLVFEREDRLAAHQTGHNSGVVHAGIYYKPGSLKAQLCTHGRALLRDYCAEHGLPYDECGKLVVAVDGAEMGRFDDLEHTARRNGVPALRRIDGVGHQGDRAARRRHRCASLAADRDHRLRRDREPDRPRRSRTAAGRSVCRARSPASSQPPVG